MYHMGPREDGIYRDQNGDDQTMEGLDVFPHLNQLDNYILECAAEDFGFVHQVPQVAKRYKPGLDQQCAIECARESLRKLLDCGLITIGRLRYPDDSLHELAKSKAVNLIVGDTLWSKPCPGEDVTVYFATIAGERLYKRNAQAR